MAKNERKAELIALAEKQKSELIEQFKSLAKIMPDSEETKAIQRELAELEKTKKDLALEEITERWNSTSISEARKKLNLVIQHLKLDELFQNNSLLIIGMLKSNIAHIESIISNNVEDTLNRYTEAGRDVIEYIEYKKSSIINDNSLKIKLNKTWEEKGLSILKKEQWTRSISLWAASKKYNNVEEDFFKYIPKEQLKNPYIFRNLIKSNISQKFVILKYVPRNFTSDQLHLIETIIEETYMLIDIINSNDDSKKITIRAKDRDINKATITKYQLFRIQKEVGNNYKAVDREGNSIKLEVKKD